MKRTFNSKKKKRKVHLPSQVPQVHTVTLLETCERG